MGRGGGRSRPERADRSGHSRSSRVAGTGGGGGADHRGWNPVGGADPARFCARHLLRGAPDGPRLSRLFPSRPRRPWRQVGVSRGAAGPPAGRRACRSTAALRQRYSRPAGPRPGRLPGVAGAARRIRRAGGQGGDVTTHAAPDGRPARAGPIRAGRSMARDATGSVPFQVRRGPGAHGRSGGPLDVVAPLGRHGRIRTVPWPARPCRGLARGERRIPGHCRRSGFDHRGVRR